MRKKEVFIFLLLIFLLFLNQSMANGYDGNDDDCSPFDTDINVLAIKGTTPSWDGDSSWGQNVALPPSGGCWVLVHDLDGGDAGHDDTGWGVVAPGGFIDNSGYKDTTTEIKNSGFDNDKSNDDAYICIGKYRY